MLAKGPKKAAPIATPFNLSERISQTLQSEKNDLKILSLEVNILDLLQRPIRPSHNKKLPPLTKKVNTTQPKKTQPKAIPSKPTQESKSTATTPKPALSETVKKLARDVERQEKFRKEQEQLALRNSAPLEETTITATATATVQTTQPAKKSKSQTYFPPNQVYSFYVLGVNDTKHQYVEYKNDAYKNALPLKDVKEIIFTAPILITELIKIVSMLQQQSATSLKKVTIKGVVYLTPESYLSLDFEQAYAMVIHQLLQKPFSLEVLCIDQDIKNSERKLLAAETPLTVNTPGCIGIKEYLKKNTTLKEFTFNLAKVGYGQDGYDILIEGIKENKSITNIPHKDYDLNQIRNWLHELHRRDSVNIVSFPNPNIKPFYKNKKEAVKSSESFADSILKRFKQGWNKLVAFLTNETPSAKPSSTKASLFNSHKAADDKKKLVSTSSFTSSTFTKVIS